jgi:hypothetical protein
VISKFLNLHWLVVFAFAVGCASGQRQDDRSAKAYRTGMTRAAVHQSLADERRLESVSRPAGGWSGGDSQYMANRAAAYFEKEHHGAVVESCEVYWIARGSNVAWVVGGSLWDYLFFDRDGKLLGYQRRVVE